MARHILVAVDDDARVRASIESVLASAGYATEMFASAEAVLASGALARAACLIADVRMPGMDGLALQRHVRHAHPRLPVIVLTAHDEEDIRRRALDGGAVALLVKPFDAAELLDAIERAVAGSPPAVERER